MDWIKVTPETMPKNGVTVLATVCTSLYGGRKYVERFAEYYECDGWLRHLEGSPMRERIESRFDRVTHWMPYPEPAED